jgi:hypothetical protein
MTLVISIGNSITGTAKFRNPFGWVQYNITGNINNNSITLYDNDIIEETGGYTWCKKIYTGTINSVDDKFVISGTYRNDGKNNYKQKNLIKGSGCPGGSFEVSKIDKENAKGQCISGDCENGIGKQVLWFGKYDGEFKNGKREGKGVFEYTKTDYKGNKYIGLFSNDAFNGYGIMYYTESKWGDYYEGNFLNNVRSGTGKFVWRDGTYYEGNWLNDIPEGLGKKYSNGFPKLGIWHDWEESNNMALPFSILKNHLDTTFSRFIKCNCLTPKEISIDAIGLGSVPYDVIDAYTGKKIREESDLDVVDKSFSANGFVNNTNHNVYIKCYRKIHFDDRNVDEYMDESYIVNPGQEIFHNYRQIPGAGTLYYLFFQNTFIFLGQYCDKTVSANCIPIPKSINGTVLTVKGPIVTLPKMIKKGNKIAINASGRVKLGDWVGYSTPEGIEGYQNYNKIEGFKPGSLLAKIGDTGKWFFVGNSKTFIAEQDGKLQFIVNDADYSNNSGGYDIEIIIK